jgi:peptidoglycan hydrolase CwlO-like protein
VAILCFAVTALLFLRNEDRKFLESHLAVQVKAAEATQEELRSEIEDLKKVAAEHEAEFAARSEELRQREAAIAGREDAATERTQSSFQGLLIQQQLTKNLEALKASLPDMTPEVEKLAKEHAQFGAERQRLEKEIAELRRRLSQPDSSVVR